MSSDAEVYLDWNATTPPLPEVLEAMHAVALSAWGNPSSVHAAGRRARVHVEEAREELAGALGRSARDVWFTSGGTEANNLALSGAPALVTSRIEHPSVVRSAEGLAERGVAVHWLPVPPSGAIEPERVGEALAGVTPGAVVAVMAANHETGVIQPIPRIAEVCRAHGALLHVDAVQAFGKLDRAWWQDADSVALAAHKIRGPKGVGALVGRPGWAPRPVLRGGAQERGLRPGTLDAAALAGFRVAVRYAQLGPERYASLAALRDRFEHELSAIALVNGEGAQRLPHVSNLSVQGFRGDELVAALDLQGVRISSGSACSAGTSEPSPVIAAMLGRGRAESAIRVSMGDETRAMDIERALHAFRRALRLQSSSS
ncbi:MAG TPA: cysteine desulfurase family protein [Polyangiaceae bacterium]|nr:cysteine desulfurase family protein [Polyangiaceae bacterium]